MRLFQAAVLVAGLAFGLVLGNDLSDDALLEAQFQDVEDELKFSVGHQNDVAKVVRVIDSECLTNIN